MDFAVVSHVFTTGPAQELVDYLRTVARSVVFVSHPFYTSSKRVSEAQRFDKHGMQGTSALKVRTGFELLDYLADLVSTLVYFTRRENRVHVYIGLDSLNSLAGIILRRFGFVRTAIFYSIDFVERRFTSALLSRVYLFLEDFSVHHADITWNLSSRVIDGRRKMGIDMESASPQIVVPTGANTSEITRLPVELINRKTLAYLGTLRKGQGLELLLDAMPRVLERVPDANLVIVGSGPLEEELKSRCDDLGIGEATKFLGFVSDHREVEKILCKSALGIAIYEPTYDNFTYYADPGKVKIYAACGLPLIITDVPEIARELTSCRAGIVVEYDARSVADTIASVLLNDDDYSHMREAAFEFAKRYSWPDIFARALAESALGRLVEYPTDTRHRIRSELT